MRALTIEEIECVSGGKNEVAGVTVNGRRCPTTTLGGWSSGRESNFDTDWEPNQ